MYIKTLDKVFKEADVSLVDVEDKNPYQYYYVRPTGSPCPQTVSLDVDRRCCC